MSKLTVYWDQEVVDTIARHPQGKISFEYAPQWIVTKGNSGSPTTHIIKPANLHIPDIQRNESFCMELAHHIELPVPKSQLYNFEGHELFLVERFDRQRTGNAATRVHQEDFCQVMRGPLGGNMNMCLSAHEKHYGESKIYANLHEVIKKNHAHLQELINDLDTRIG